MAPPRSAVAAKLQQAHDDLLPSEDEDDEDFELEDGEGDDGGSDSSDSERESGPAPKRAKPDDDAAAAPALDKSAVDDLWASFNDASADPYASTSALDPPVQSTSSSPSTTTRAAPAPTKNHLDDKGKGKGKAKANLDQSDLVTIKVTYKFAGDTITQDKKVARDSQEARDYFLLHPDAAVLPSASAPAPPRAAADPTTASIDALFGPDDSTSTPSTAAPPVDSSAPTPAPAPAPAPAKRKRAGGGGLGAMAASLGVGAKPAKLNTLEKSKLDWTSYVQTQEGLEDTLQHARKDGYLEKKDFLDRVEMRKEEGWEKGRKKGPR
ncbi:hypothetical protein JCM11491_000128 [Sporobolomyces phaffii]